MRDIEEIFKELECDIKKLNDDFNAFKHEVEYEMEKCYIEHKEHPENYEVTRVRMKTLKDVLLLLIKHNLM